MGRRAWFKFYPSNYISGIQDLTPEEVGIYSVLISLMYDRGGPIPDDPQWIAGLCGKGCSVRKWKAARSRLIDLGKLQVMEDGRLMNPRVGWQILPENEEHDKLAKNGAKGGRKTAENLSVHNEYRHLAKKGLPETDSERTSPRSADNWHDRYETAAHDIGRKSPEIVLNGSRNFADNLSGSSEYSELEEKGLKNGAGLLDSREVSKEASKLASLPSDSVAPRAGGTLPPPSGSASVVAAIPVAAPSFQAEPEPEEPVVLTRNKMPRLSDPPSKWCIPELTTQMSRDDNGTSRPTVCGFHIDILARQICEAAAMDRPNWRGDWWTIASWLHSGFGSDHILGAIKERRARFGQRWRPPDALIAFDSCVREYRPQRSAA